MARSSSSPDLNMDEPVTSMFSFADVTFRYEPFPIGVARNLFEPAYYNELVNAWPPTELFQFQERLGKKYSLSELNHAQQYRRFVRSSAPWRRLHEYVKSRDFLYHTIGMLFRERIDLGLGGHYLAGGTQGSRLLDGLKVRIKTRHLSARFEYSMLPAADGSIKPHTDSPQKIITLVVSMLRSGEWPESFGGGTEMLRPRDTRENYNYMNRQLEFDEVETIDTFSFEPNQTIIFVKTFNSLHAVRPIAGHGSGIMRKTLTINIERQ